MIISFQLPFYFLTDFYRAKNAPFLMHKPKFNLLKT